MKRLKAGIAQMRSESDPWLNLLLVEAFIREAEAMGCEFICFPENVFFRGPKNLRGEAYLSLDHAGAIDSRSEFARAVAESMRHWAITVSLGSVLEVSRESELPFNCHWIVHPGARIETYRKIHLFEFLGERADYAESRDVQGGHQAQSTRVGPFTFGMSVCYDLRFPELYRFLTLSKSTEALLVPSAFTLETGRAHWHTLLRARAIENLSYVLAAAQWGTHQNAKGERLRCYGHSLAYGPWGELLAEAPEEGDALLVVELDRGTLSAARARLPSWQKAALKISV